MGVHREVCVTILVGCGTKLHGTEGLAATMSDSLRANGFGVDVIEAREVGDASGYEAFMVRLRSTNAVGPRMPSIRPALRK